jgi:hypothetical protein
VSQVTASALKKIPRLLFQVYVFILEVISKLLIWLGNRSRFELFLILIGLMWLIGFSALKESTRPREQSGQVKAQKSDEEIRKEMVWRLDALKIRSIRDSMKNPASFELVDVTKMDDGTLCVTYRGTNSFNAITTEYVAVLSNAQIGRWNKVCAGKSGRDLTYIKYAI